MKKSVPIHRDNTLTSIYRLGFYIQKQRYNTLEITIMFLLNSDCKLTTKNLNLHSVHHCKEILLRKDNLFPYLCFLKGKPKKLTKTTITTIIIIKISIEKYMKHYLKTIVWLFFHSLLAGSLSSCLMSSINDSVV